MPIVETILQLIVELGRAALMEALSERVRRVQIRRLRGMNDVRRHIRHRTRQRFLNRLSTGLSRKRLFP